MSLVHLTLSHVVSSAAGGKLSSATTSIKPLSSLLEVDGVSSAMGMGNFHQVSLPLSSIEPYQPPGDPESCRSRR